MVKFYKDEHKFTAEAEVDLEMQSLKDFSMHSPAFLAKRLKSLAASSTSEINVEGAASPIPSPPKFPLPPVFLSGSLGEKQLQLLSSTNVKVKLIIFIVSIALVASVGLGVWNLTIFYSNQSSHEPGEPAWAELEAKLEVSLQAVNELSVLVKNLTSSAQTSLTRNTTHSKISSWSGRPKYTWA